MKASELYDRLTIIKKNVEKILNGLEETILLASNETLGAEWTKALQQKDPLFYMYLSSKEFPSLQKEEVLHDQVKD